ncbi:MAG: hypothetical protein MK142_02060 [Pseudomonadales bacterium]|nr:hypothetical protein [Pseudomonadales bacterium]
MTKRARLAFSALLAGAPLLAAIAATPDVEIARAEPARKAIGSALDAVAGTTFDCADIAAAEAAGAALWRRGVAAGAAALDDRALYWARLRTAGTLAAGALPTCAGAAIFESTSRGFADVQFDDAADLRVLVTGFDPFLLDREITQGNPSGVTAVALDGDRHAFAGKQVQIETVIVPVRYQDFDDGLVETTLVPLAERLGVDLLITVSMGRSDFDLERFPGRRRSATAPDNRNVLTGANAEAPLVPALGDGPLAGPEFVEFTLPIEAMLEVGGDYAVHDNRAVTTLEAGTLDAPNLEALADQTAVRGGGGGYLSNEISYRVVNALARSGSSIRSGHIHTPRMPGYDRETVEGIVTQTEALVLSAARALLD